MSTSETKPKRSFIVTYGGAFILLMLLLAILGVTWKIVNDGKAVTAAAVQATPQAHPKPITPDTAFALAAASYLKTANAQGQNVAKTMAAISDGTSTLAEVRDAMQRAQRVEGAGYSGDYSAKVVGKIPAEDTTIAANIDETHRLFQASMREFLEFWTDQSTMHISSGQATLKKSFTLMNQCISDISGKIK